MSERNYIEKQDILNILLYLGYEFKNPYYIEILSNYMLGAPNQSTDKTRKFKIDGHRFESIGDSVLHLVVVEELSSICLSENYNFYDMTINIGVIVSNKNLRSCKLIRRNTLSTARLLEAIIGAIYLDSENNMEICKRVTLEILRDCDRNV
jgi:dsRNA-specific ribonuclease